MTRIGRRALVAGLAGALAARRARAMGPWVPPLLRDLEVRELVVEGDPAISNRFVLCVPTHLDEGQKVPLLVVLHGLAETKDSRTGAFAFVEHYGLLEAYERLRRPPVTRTFAKSDYFGDDALRELNASLASKPLRGLAIACPYMPRPSQFPNESAALDRYAAWLADVVIPRARKEAPVYADPAHTSLDGVSLGGYVGLEVMTRKPELFGAFGTVQAAYGAARIPGYADRLAAAHKASPKDFHFETSTLDPWRESTKGLAAALAQRGVPHELLVLPGPHDQPWLEESGTLAMLRWHDARER